MDPTEMLGYLETAAAVVGIAAMVATRTNNTSANKAIKVILDIINMLAMNLGKSKNK